MVFRPPVRTAPALGITSSSSNAFVTWPAKSLPGVLQQTAHLSGPNWIVVSNVVSATGQSNIATVPLSATNVFFRLQMLE